ncbi:MAG TPA: hypothetical protein VIV60_37610, partial [Polyangiaceae bacterium]
MIERELHRTDPPKQNAIPLDQLSRQHSALVDHVACTAFERGYARYVPDLKTTLDAFVRRLSELLVSFIVAETQSAYHPGEELEGDPLVAFIRREVEYFASLG